MNSPMTAVRDVVGLLGEIEWARCVGGVEPLRPPFLAWRFKHPVERVEQMIVDAVVSYSGVIEWVMRKGARNWVIEPAGFAAYAAKFQRDVDAVQSFGAEFPSQTSAALEDAIRLADHLRRSLIPH
jgi:hypothetical protein